MTTKYTSITAVWLGKHQWYTTQTLNGTPKNMTDHSVIIPKCSTAYSDHVNNNDNN